MSDDLINKYSGASVVDGNICVSGYMMAGAHPWKESLEAHPEEKYPIRFLVKLSSSCSEEGLANNAFREQLAKISEIHSDRSKFVLDTLDPLNQYGEPNEGSVYFNLYFDSMDNCKKVLHDLFDGIVMDTAGANRFILEAERKFGSSSQSLDKV